MIVYFEIICNLEFFRISWYIEGLILYMFLDLSALTHMQLKFFTSFISLINFFWKLVSPKFNLSN